MDEVLARSGIFQGVDPEAAEALAKEMDTIEVRKGDIVFNEGEAGDSLYIVLSGKIKLGRRAADGRQNLVLRMALRPAAGELGHEFHGAAALEDPGVGAEPLEEGHEAGIVAHAGVGHDVLGLPVLFTQFAEHGADYGPAAGRVVRR